MKPFRLLLLALLLFPLITVAQRRKKKGATQTIDTTLATSLSWRNIGPFRGGRSVASTGVVNDKLTYYFGSVGGGVWKTEDAGIHWKNTSDGFFKTGTVGAIAVSESDPNVVYVGMGEHPIRGVMTSSGDGMYKSTDAGASWEHIGLPNSQHISDVVIHPTNPDIVLVAVQGAQYGPSPDRGIYKSLNGGKTWTKTLYVSENTGASSLSMDMKNPRILYAAMWQHRRKPWTMESGGKESGLYKSTDGGDTWKPMKEGLPEEMGKIGVSVSRANPSRIWAVIEAEGEKGGVYRSDDSGKKWMQVNKDRINIARAWYYMEIFADPQDENTVYVLNAPVTKSIDGGKTFTPVATPHGDNHHLWINPTNNQVMINSNDGGANISMNGGASWSSQQNQPTAQFYRVITDNLVPFNVYGGQQDNTAIAIASQVNGQGIGWKDWHDVAGCESAFLAFDPDNPEVVFGGCYQGIIEQWVKENNTIKGVQAYPELGLGSIPVNMKYRFNWNAPIIASPHNSSVIYHGGNHVLKTTDGGMNWEVISPDLTRNEKDKQGPGGKPFTNEAAGGENYNTLMSLVESPHEVGVIWTGSDDGLVYITKDGGTNWKNVTPAAMPAGIVNTIAISPHDNATAYVTTMNYKNNDLKPYVYKTTDYGQSWTTITTGLDQPYTFARVVREDPKVPGLLYAGTETGLYISTNGGENWLPFQGNLPVVPINDFTFRQNSMVVATAGRSFWILDDLSPVQQSKGAVGDATLAIYKPKDTYMLPGGNVNYTAEAFGQNPASGVVMHYYIKAKQDSIPVTLTVKDVKGKTIKTFTSEPDKEFKTWIGGPPKPEVLPAKTGFNRFVWNMDQESLPGVEDVFTFGGLSGSSVLPGTYTLTLSYNDQTASTTSTLLPDPRMPYTAADYTAKKEFMATVDVLVTEIHESVNAMRTAKKQLNLYQELLKEKDQKTLVNKADTIVKAITTWENELIQPKQKTFQDVVNFENKLTSHLLYLKEFVASADPRITTGAKERLKDLKEDWAIFKAEQERIITQEMGSFNTLYKNAGLEALILD